MENTSAVIASGVINLIGWGLWLVLTASLSKQPATRWVMVDYSISTTLLVMSSICTLSGAFLTDPAGVTRVTVPLALIALGVLIWRSLRRASNSMRLQYAAQTVGNVGNARSITIEQLERMESPL